MASIFTQLAFMHGHIVDLALVQRLGRDVDAGVPAPGLQNLRMESRPDPLCRAAAVPVGLACACAHR